jgi:hypothetical protein
MIFPLKSARTSASPTAKGLAGCCFTLRVRFAVRILKYPNLESAALFGMRIQKNPATFRQSGFVSKFLSAGY